MRYRTIDEAEAAWALLKPSTGKDILALSAVDDSPETKAKIERIYLALDKYFSRFIYIPKEDSNILLSGPLCVCCGNALGGLLGAFGYSLGYGEGHCRVCGWPGRANHRVSYEGGDLNPFLLIVCYHPSGLTPEARLECFERSRPCTS